jgi:hypothetical protein
MTRLRQVLAQHKRVAIVGGPRTGKTTASLRVTDRPVIHTDGSMSKPWEDQPELIKQAVGDRERFVVEGVQTGRALRKGLEVDAVVIADQPKQPLTKGQRAMAKGCEKILNDYLASAPGVPVYRLEEE